MQLRCLDVQKPSCEHKEEAYAQDGCIEEQKVTAYSYHLCAGSLTSALPISWEKILIKSRADKLLMHVIDLILNDVIIFFACMFIY